MIISKNICLGMVAALLSKPDVCMEHFLNVITHCHDSGHPKLLCHLVTLLFPFGLESWHMIKCLSGSAVENRSSVIDQSFFNVMAFYYRAMLTDTLNSQRLNTREKYDLDGSQQNSFSQDLVENPSTNRTMEPNTGLVNTNGAYSCEKQNSEDDGQSTECFLESSSVGTMPKMDLDSSKTGDHDEGTVNLKIPEKVVIKNIFNEIYQIALACSTVLLSDIYSQLQKNNGNVETNVSEEDEHLERDRKESREETKVVTVLSVSNSLVFKMYF